MKPQQTYCTLGPYDMSFIAEAPDNEAISTYLLKIGSTGNIRTLTLRVYEREEISGIVGRLG